MSGTHYLLFLLFVLNSYKTNEANARPEIVKITVYYESLCPYSREFITDHFYPGYQKIKSNLIAELVPYGKANQAKSNGKWIFNCQHGPRECTGNKIQACILRKQFPIENKIDFINCVMNSSDPASFTNGQICSNLSNVDWQPIVTCAQSDEGNWALSYFGEITKSADPKVQYVPHIVFNGIFNATIENQARNDFLKTVCQLYVIKPDGCKQ